MPEAAALDARPGALSDGLMRLDVRADAAQVDCLLAWLALLDRWNRAFNLTAIPPGERVARLVLMSAAVIPRLAPGSVLDVGSGAGVPGVPLAILAPGNGYTLIDSNGKKTRFLEQCRMELGLENVRVVRARVEAFDGGAFDTIVSRAFAELGAFLAATRHLTRVGTRRIAFKGAGAVDEARRLPPDKAKWQLHRLRIPGLDQPASLVVVREPEAEA